MRLPIGYDNFGELIENKFDFVDKTLMIKEFIDNDAKVTLVTRPRRFGKSLNLSMLQHFFANKAYGKSTKGLFDHLKIAQAGSGYMLHQGQYPVIFLNFKDMNATNAEHAYAKLCHLLSRAFDDHINVLESPKVSDHHKFAFDAVIAKKADLATIENALLDLSRCLYDCYEVKPVLLIDEYDTPIQSGYMNNYYEQIIGLMRNLFSAGLKGNSYLHKAMLTGILRVSKESLFSGLNNVEVYSLFDEPYSEYFGFTEQEVNDLLKESKLDGISQEVKYWYNGYQFGNHVIYNPWSIVHCIQREGLLRPYWVNTSGNTLIKDLMRRAGQKFKTEFESILHGVPVEKMVDVNFVFGDLENNEDLVWSLLLESGYLKALDPVPNESQMQCKLLSPNYEITSLYRGIVSEWFTDRMSQSLYSEFLRALTEGKIDEFTKILRAYLRETASLFDVKGKQPEKFYHGFVLGLIASLGETHTVKSNRESGYGRYDVMLIPKDKNKLGVIMEFKTADDTEDLATAATDALTQITQRDYAAELQQHGITRILKIGAAFKGKDVSVQSDYI